MKLMPYAYMSISRIRFTSNPINLILTACDITQQKMLTDRLPSISVDQDAKERKLIKFLVTANHTSVFEHASITFLIQRVSRSFLAQITRHRIGSFTSASQHYTSYEGFPCMVDERLIDREGQGGIFDYLQEGNELYENMCHEGVPKEEARQILPNAKAVNILWTVNARSLINFLNQRLCKRNVKEMLIFAQLVRDSCIDWFPELFDHVGPDCEMLGVCRQGKMKAEVCDENFSR